MWIRDGCIIAVPPIDLIPISGAKPIVTYARYILELAHNVPIYLTYEPVVAPIRIGFIKRSIVLPPFSAIICDNARLELFNEFYKVVDGVWVNAGRVTPYVRDDLCGLVKLLGLALCVNNTRGVPYVCLDSPHIDYKLYRQVANGGFIEISNASDEGPANNIEIESSRDMLHTFIKRVVKDCHKNLERQYVRFRPIAIDKDLGIYAKPLILIDRHLVVAKLGRGYVYSLDINTDLAQTLYHILLLATFTKHPDL